MAMRQMLKYSRLVSETKKEPHKHNHSYSDRQYWINPIWMISSFLAGLALAVAHHIYYTKLDNTPVGSTARQQWPIRIGTTFAFLLKTCYTSATGIAYIQLVWRKCCQQHITISNIDAAFSADRNFFVLFRVDFVRRFPVAFGLTTILWCIPLSSLVAPATLGIASLPEPRTYSIPVYEPNISNPGQRPWNDEPERGRPVKLQRMIDRIAQTGQLPQLGSPKGLQNVSYTTNVILPLIRCKPMEDGDRPWLLGELYDALNSTKHHDDLSIIDLSIMNGAAIMEENLKVTSSNGSVIGGVGYYSSIRQYNYALPYDSSMPELHIAVANSTSRNPGDLVPNTQGVGYYTCRVHNATVAADFTFVDNVQSLQIIDVMESAAMPSWNSSDGSDGRFDHLKNYQYFASTLYTHLKGLAAALSVINGAGTVMIWDTYMDQEIFGNSKDFSDMCGIWGPFLCVAPDSDAPPEKDLITMIEEFAFNTSLGLLSVPVFRKEVPAQVTQTLWVNKYTYDPRNLLIAYGISTLASLLAVLVGSYAFYTNDESYNNSFSSIGKAFQGDNIAAVFTPRSMNAREDAVRIKKTKIRLYKDGGGEHFNVAKEEK